MPAFYGAIQTLLLLYASGLVVKQNLVANAVFLLRVIVANVSPGLLAIMDTNDTSRYN